MKRVRALVLVLAGALVLAGCTLVPTNENPSTIDHVGFELLSPTIPGTDNGRVVFITRPIYIVDATGHLSPLSRIIPSPATLDSILEELLAGPTSIERFAGYTSDLPKGFVLVGATLKDKVGVLDIATPLTSLSREDQILALGQLVLTAYDVGATAGIEITVAGTPHLSLLPDGSRRLIVTREDFASLLNP
ncbi:MAG: GerMN domain-containing protein [Acidimicrobiales bacterium]